MHEHELVNIVHAQNWVVPCCVIQNDVPNALHNMNNAIYDVLPFNMVEIDMFLYDK